MNLTEINLLMNLIMPDWKPLNWSSFTGKKIGDFHD